MVVRAFDDIDLTESRSVFSAYVDGLAPVSTDYNRTIIFPFGCNRSQRRATESAMSNSMSIIEGPPGTGKTQTILNIIANIIYSGKSVTVISNNNSAVHNVQEKLEKSGYGSLVASLGNNFNRKVFFGRDNAIEKFEEHELDEDQISEVDSHIASLTAELDECFQKRNRVSQLKEMLSEAQNEQRHLYIQQPLDREVYDQIDQEFKSNKLKHNYMALRQIVAKGKLSIIDKLILLFKYGYFDILHVDDYIDALPIYANHKFYELHISAIQTEIEELEGWLESVDEQSKLKSLIELSLKLFRATLSMRYRSMEKIEFERESYKSQFSEFIKRYPVITSSTLSLHTSVPKGYLFDYLVIDEASQVDIIKASICFANARRVIVVGDSCQLKHIVGRDSVETVESIHDIFNVAAAYNYATKSILDSLKELYGSNIPTTMLREHYRCHPDIIGFCNKRFYNDELLVMTQQESDNASPFRIIETSIGGSKGLYNQRQIDETAQYIVDNFADHLDRVGVISPYRTHADMLQSQLPKGCEADTIHKFQGREKDVIIFNSVANQINSFIDNPNLINVAVSRAVESFVIVKPQSMELPHGTSIGDLVRYICYRYNKETTIQNGVIGSVFDLLYKEYNHLYINFASKNRDVAGSPAEVIAYRLLDEILQEPQFASIDFLREYFLRDLVRDINCFEQEQVEYIRHGARLDFLLYNKIDRCPILAIEVDGVTFHKAKKQQQRDALKNSILEQLKLPLLRLSTDGHSEPQRILESLQNAMSFKA